MQPTLTRLLGVEHPVIQAPIGSASCPALAAAVSNAGGLGMLALSWRKIDAIQRLIRETKALTSQPFGVNLVLEWPQEERLRACLDEGVKIVSFFWGEPSPLWKIAHDAGAVVLHQVGSVDEALRSCNAGTDAIVAQGFEAGGHIRGTTTAAALLSGVVAIAGESGGGLRLDGARESGGGLRLDGARESGGGLRLDGAGESGGGLRLDGAGETDTATPDWKYICKVWPQERTVQQNRIDLQLAA